MSTDNLGAPINANAQHQELLGHLRWGMPSMLLALVTLGIWFYSETIVEPGLESRYRRLCDSNLARLGILSAPSDEDFGQFEPTGTERLELLDQTELCLRRLIVINNLDATSRYQSGLVSEATAKELSILATQDVEDGQADVDGHLAASAYNLSKANDAMRDAERLGGEYGLLAMIWLANKQLGLIDQEQFEPERAMADISATENKLSTFASQNPKRHDLTETLAHAKFAKSFLDPNLLSDNAALYELKSDLSELHSLLSEKSTANVKELAWLATAELTLDDDRAYTTARKAIARFWEGETAELASAIDLSALYLSMMLVGDHQSADEFLLSRTRKLSPEQIQIIKKVAAIACLRLLAARSVGSRIQDPPEPRMLDLLNTALRLYPQSRLAGEILFRASIAKDGDYLAAVLNKPEAASKSVGLTGLKEVIKQMDLGNHQDAKVALEDSVLVDPEWVSIAGDVVATLVDSQKLDMPSGLSIITWLTEAKPNNLNLAFRRATLCARYGYLDEAIESLEWVAANLPDNLQVAIFLQQVREQASLAETPDQDNR